MDIRAAFLQAKNLYKDIFIQLLKDIQMDGVIWILLKPLYGLDDASRSIWIMEKETFLVLGLWTKARDR